MTLLAAALFVQMPIADLPFERVGNRIYLKATLNGNAVNAVLDTGAGSTVADTEVGEAAGAKKAQEIVAGGAGASTVKGWFVSDLNLKLDGTDVRHPIPVILPLAPLTVMEGRPLQTVLGYDFLQRYRVEIDYAAGRLRLFSPSVDTVPTGASELPIEFVQNTPRINGKVEVAGLGAREVTMMLDTGATTAATLTAKAVGDMKLDDRYKDVPELVLGGGVGGQTKGRRVRLPALTLGSIRVARPVAYLDSTGGGATGRQANYDVLVGGETLRRFTLTLDYAHKRIFLKPNADFAEPFVGDKVGLSVGLGAGGEFTVRQVVPDSPASEAGIGKDTVILAINGRPVTTLEDLRRAFRAAQGDLRLRIRQADTERVAVLKTRELVP